MNESKNESINQRMNESTTNKYPKTIVYIIYHRSLSLSSILYSIPIRQSSFRLFFLFLLSRLLLLQRVALLQHFHARLPVCPSLPSPRSYTPSSRARGFFRPPPSSARRSDRADDFPPIPAISRPSRPAGLAAHAAPRSPRGPLPAVPASRTNSPRSTMKRPRNAHQSEGQFLRRRGRFADRGRFDAAEETRRFRGAFEEFAGT